MSTENTSDATAVPSCRIDTLTLTYRAPTVSVYDDICDLAYQVNSYVDGGRPLKFKGKGKHFTHVFSGGGLVVLEGTPPVNSDGSASEARNAGCLALTLNGQFFAACDVTERQALLLQFSAQQGFYHCTRMDGQITIVNPEQSAEWIVSEVDDGALWAAGFQSQRVYGTKNRDGDFVSGATQYWGGLGSEITARSYNKGLEAGWSEPAVRHELQLRKTRARDRFIQLRGALQRQSEAAPLFLTAEADFVKTMLSQDLDYRDTGKWRGKRKPKNWAQSAPTAGWWREATGCATDDFEYSRRPKSDLDQSDEARRAQYGRKEALKILKDAINSDQLIQEVLMDSFLKNVLMTREGDAALIALELPEAELGAIQERLTALQGAAARYAETGCVFRADGAGWPFSETQNGPIG